MHTITDAHVHLWDPARFPIRWVAGHRTLDRAYTITDYWQHVDGLPVDALIYVQVDVAPAYGLLEAHDIAAAGRREPRLAGMVAWAPLEDGAIARSYLDALAAIGPMVRGVRRILQGEPDPAYCLQPEFVAGVHALADYGWSFDLCINHRQLAAATELVRRCPQVQFILDHIAKPDIRARRHDPWRAQLAQLAEHPNVVCKISGVITEADHQHWTADELTPYIDHALACFGGDRVMFGSDWPVLLEAASFRRWIEIVDDRLHRHSAAAHEQCWSATARRVYRLP